MFFCHQPGKKILLVIQLNQNRPDKPILMKPAKGHDKGNDKISHHSRESGMGLIACLGCLNSVKVGLCSNIQRAIGHHWGGVNWYQHIGLKNGVILLGIKICLEG